MLKKCTPLGREAHLEVKMLKRPGVRTTFGSSDLEKVHAVVARSTFRSQNVRNTILGPLLEVEMLKKCTPLWRENISKSKCTNTCVGRLLEVEMSKKCTLLWRKAHLEVKMLKTLGVRTTLGRSDVASLRFTTLLHYTTLRYTPLHYTTLHYTPQHYNYNYTTTLHYTPLHYWEPKVKIFSLQALNENISSCLNLS